MSTSVFKTHGVDAGPLAAPAAVDSARLAARILLAVMFILGGWSKIGGYAGTQAYTSGIKF
jgi:uncharacterized membrane protein YphA (DoxX/SURF4 family)